MNKKNTYVLLLIVIILIIVGVFYYFLKSKENVNLKNNLGLDLSIGSSTTSLSKIEFDNSFTENEHITSEELANLPSDMPDLESIRSAINGFSSQALKEQILEVLSDLENNPNTLDGWLNLGIKLKVSGFLRLAENSWIYAGKLRPKNSISFMNLADLYGYYLNKPDLAEVNFKVALKNGPEDAEIYYRMAMFYLDILDDKKKAIGVLNQGLKNIPKDPQLTETLNFIQNH